MKRSHVVSTIVCLLLTFAAAFPAHQPSSPPAGPAKPAVSPDLPVEQVIDRVVQRENELVKSLANYSPLVETYIQNLMPDKTLTFVPKSDVYFLGKLDLTQGVTG